MSDPALRSGPPADDVREHLARAIERHRQGDLAAAEALYEHVLAAVPDHAQALHLFGMLRFRQGRPADALRLVAAALAAGRRTPGVLSNHGLVLDALGRFDEALASYDEALAGAPEDADILANRGNTLGRTGRFAEALAAYDGVLARRPADVEALANRSFALIGLKQYAQALTAADRALAIDPRHGGALNNRGKALLELGRFMEALACFDQVVAIAPDHADAHANRAHVLTRLDRQDEALAACERALALAPAHVGAHVNRGNALRRLGRVAEALASYDEALRLRPDQADVIGNRGTALADLGRHDDALKEFARARALAPDDPDIRWNQSLVQLRTGDFHAGWRNYEARWARQDFSDGAWSFAAPLWRGAEPLAGKTILLHAEQGLGDTIQFVRYAPLLVARGATVLLEVQPPLKRLLGQLPGVTHVLARGEPYPAVDFRCPLMSLPLAFGTEIGTIPADVPYLFASSDQVAAWWHRLDDADRLHVGLVWAGNPAHTNDRNRSIAPARLAPLLAAKGVRFVSLQKRAAQGETEWLCDAEVLDLAPDLADFTDTAAAISCLDLVVTVDTAVAHLAGAMGKPVWILLPYVPDWRWLLGRADSPWYPTARLWRQPAIGDWDSVIARVGDELRRLTARGRAAFAG